MATNTPSALAANSSTWTENVLVGEHDLLLGGNLLEVCRVLHSLNLLWSIFNEI